MSGNNSLLAALVGVISSGTRRKVTYIRQQALVSQLYPYFFEDNHILSQNNIYNLDLIYVPIYEQIIVDNLGAENALYEIYLKDSTLNALVLEDNTVSSVNNIYEISLKTTLINLTLLDDQILSAGNSVYEVFMPQVLITVGVSDDSQLYGDNSVYETLMEIP